MTGLDWWAAEILPRSASAPLPLSFSQQRLWFLEQLEPGTALYNVARGLHLSGPLDLPALQQSLDTIVARHESLRTTFPAEDGRPIQVVTPPTGVPLEVVEMPPLPESEQQDGLMRLVSSAAMEPFDLTRGPLFRARLIRVGRGEHVLLLLMHHIVTDRWSLSMLLRELSECYRAFLVGENPRLPELPVQYGDYVIWQRAGLGGTRLDELLEYWRSQLDGVPPVLELPTDRPRPAVETHQGTRLEKLFPRRLVRDLRALGRQENASLYMVLLGAFQVLLARYTGRRDIVVGSPIAGRMNTKLDSLIGFFVNTLALRTDLSGNPTFRRLLGRVREAALEAYAHQELPFERVVEAVQPDRSLHHAPLVQVVLAFQNTPRGALELPGLTVRELRIPDQPAKFDLVLYLVEQEDGLRAAAEYRTELFDAATMERLLGHYQTVLEAIVADPDRRISTLPLTTEDERRRVLLDWNATDAELPAATVHELFEIQVQRTPEALALLSSEGRLTYAELNRRANRLAYHLRGLGVGPEVRVAVLLERSTDLIIALLAILKAGGVYLALDPELPEARFAWTLEDAGARVIVTRSVERERLQSMPRDAAVVYLPADPDLLASLPDTAPSRSAGPENLAYVSYTSGSTGTPKGVAIPHRGIVRLVRENPYTRFAPDEVFLQLAPVAFDASTFEIWGPLLNGARLVLAPPGKLTLEELGGVLRRYGVTTLWLTAGLFHLMVDERLDGLRGVRHLLAGGDVLSPPHVRRMLSELPQCRLVNGYGPTECTTFSTCHAVAPDGNLGLSVPIGRPIANTQVYVLDPFGVPVPVGIPGELYVGGAGLARGYLDRPGLTAERFVPDAFSGTPGARLYGTGDRVRWRPNGTLEFLGRLDRQVKIRGHRVEPGEVEAVLVDHPAVREAAVVVREDETGDRRLVSYLVPDDSAERPPSGQALREYLSLRLPEYMMPGAFVWLETMPLTPQGKVDREALPAPSSGSAGWDAEPAGTVAPRSEAEATLAGIWAQVLGLERVGVHDNFFSLGGDSILSLQIIAHASRVGLRLTPRQLFEHQTVAELAAVAETARSTVGEQGTVTGPVPLTPIQHWFFEQDIPEPHRWNQTVELELREPLDPEALEHAFQALVEHHDALRLRFFPEGESWSQVNAGLERHPILCRVDLWPLKDEERGPAVEAAMTRLEAGMNLSRGPLVGAVALERGPGRKVRLLCAIHHLAVDGVSWRILLDDLQRAYSQLCRGEPVRLPAKTTSFKRWAREMEAFARSPELRSELSYWLAEGRLRPPSLPVDLPGRNTLADARTLSVTLDEEDTRALLHEVPPVYGTQINDCLLVALTEAFGRWTGARRLLVDLEGHGREEVIEGLDLSRTVGWFTSICPALLDLSDSLDPGEALKSMKEQLRAIPRRGIGYGLLRYLSADPAVFEWLRALPAPQVSFNYLGRFDQLPESSGLEWVGEPIGLAHLAGEGDRRYLLSIKCSVRNDRLSVTWTYSPALHRAATVEALAEAFLTGLRRLVSHCRAPGSGSYTPSDFPDAVLSQRELDRLLAGLDESVED